MLTRILGIARERGMGDVIRLGAVRRFEEGSELANIELASVVGARHRLQSVPMTPRDFPFGGPVADRLSANRNLSGEASGPTEIANRPLDGFGSHGDHITDNLYDRKPDFCPFFRAGIRRIMKWGIRMLGALMPNATTIRDAEPWVPRRPIIDTSREGVRDRVKELQAIEKLPNGKFATSLGMTTQQYTNFMSLENEFRTVYANAGCDLYGWSLDYVFRGDPKNLSDDIKASLGFLPKFG